MKANKTKIIVRFVGTFFSIVTVVSVGLLLLVPELRFWEPESEAAANCEYGSYPAGTCPNTVCPDARYCAMNPVVGADSVKCLSISTSDIIYDCCPAGKILNRAETLCVTPPVNNVCQTYGIHPENTCTNTRCPVGRHCSSNPVVGADSVKCLSLPMTGDFIYDCCPAGMILNETRTQCVTPTATTTSTPSVTTTATTVGTPSGTGNVTFTASATAVLTTIPPVTTGSQTATHVPADTGFREDILLYLGGVLYGVGVLAFIYARTMTRKVGSQPAG